MKRDRAMPLRWNDIVMLSTCYVFILLATLACCTQEPEENNQRTIIDFNRNIKADVDGKIEIGPCGRPKSILNADITDSGNTKIQGNIFNLMETAGKLAELLKIIGSKFKPLVPCPSTPAPTENESPESLCFSELKKCSAILDQTLKTEKSNINEVINNNDESKNEKCDKIIEKISVEVVTNPTIKTKLKPPRRNLRVKNQRRRRRRIIPRNKNPIKHCTRPRLSRRRSFRKQRRYTETSLNTRKEMGQKSFFETSKADGGRKIYPGRKIRRRRSRNRRLRQVPRKRFRKSLRTRRTPRKRPRLCRSEQR